MKKRFLILFLTLVIAFSCSGCAPLMDADPETLSIYASFYPIYALTEMIVEGVPDLTLHCLVQPQDGCLRSYSLSDWDLYMLSYGAGAIVLGGSGLESFSDALRQSAEQTHIVVEALTGLELAENPEIEHDETLSHWEGDNPYLYLSVDGAMKILNNLSDALSVMDPRYAEKYEANLAAALTKMENLNAEIEAVRPLSHGKKAALLNEAMLYIAEDYEMEIAAVIPRKSGASLAQSELENCIEQLQSGDVEIVLIEKQAPQPLIAALESAGFQVAQIDTMSTRRENEGSDGFFEAQRENIQVVLNACNQED